ncbi:MAG: arsenate reductase (glutaredoxin) [Flavobacteriales bacterium]|nr:arsenate reductase (glutaredoxin) [Flavobacteriales bacterium]
MKIFHNPSCSKSRETLDILKNSGKNVEIIEYLKQTPSKEELFEIVNLLGGNAELIVRKTEEIYKEKFKGKKLTQEEWIDAMLKYPKLIERPIVIDGKKAIIGRPPTNVLELL